eukprot:gene39358-48633_t
MSITSRASNDHNVSQSEADVFTLEAMQMSLGRRRNEPSVPLRTLESETDNNWLEVTSWSWEDKETITEESAASFERILQEQRQRPLFVAVLHDKDGVLRLRDLLPVQAASQKMGRIKQSIVTNKSNLIVLITSGAYSGSHFVHGHAISTDDSFAILTGDETDFSLDVGLKLGCTGYIGGSDNQWKDYTEMSRRRTPLI